MYRASAAAARRALRADPRSFDAHALIGWALLADVRRAADRRETFPKIEAAARTCIRIDPRNSQGHLLLAWTHLFQGRLAAASDCAETALKYNPDGRGERACKKEVDRARRSHLHDRAALDRSRKRRTVRTITRAAVVVFVLAALGGLGLGAVVMALGTPDRPPDARFAGALDRFETIEETVATDVVLEPHAVDAAIAELEAAAIRIGSMATGVSAVRTGEADELGRLARRRVELLRSALGSAIHDGPYEATREWRVDWNTALDAWNATL